MFTGEKGILVADHIFVTMEFLKMTNFSNPCVQSCNEVLILFYCT